MGATNSGSDYYFSYGDVLYIVLNSNNRNAAEHSKLMEKAIKSAPNAKWKVVAFHHDIYGSGQHTPILMEQICEQFLHRLWISVILMSA